MKSFLLIASLAAAAAFNARLGKRAIFDKTPSLTSVTNSEKLNCQELSDPFLDLLKWQRSLLAT